MTSAVATRLDPPPLASIPSAWAPPKVGRFAFAHPALRKAGTHFAQDADRSVSFKFDLGDVRGTLQLHQVAATFDLTADHPDRVLLAQIPDALKFVSKIAANDPIPNEIVDGSPSWTPREEYLDRAVRKVERSLGLEETARVPLAIEASAVALAGHFARFGRVPNARDMFDVIGAVARAEWLCRRVVAVQGLVGGLARAASGTASKSAAETARSAARALRQAAIWAGQQAMRADAAAADPVDALADADSFRAKVHPVLAALRAFSVDVDGLLADWRRLRARAEGALTGELETLAGTAIMRYATYDPRRFETAATGHRARVRTSSPPPQWSAQ